MRNNFVLAALAAAFAFVVPAYAGPTFSTAGGIGAAACAYDANREPTLGVGCSFSITSAGVATGVKVKPAGGSVARLLEQHFTDYLNPVDFGAVGDGATESGPAVLSTINLSRTTGAPVYFPYSGPGYKVDFTPPGFSFVSNGVTYSYPNILLGEYHFNNSFLFGTGMGDPKSGNALTNVTFTNPYNTTVGIKYTFDPAPTPQISAGIGSAAGGVTNIGMSIECAPNRPNPNSYDSAGTHIPNHNWIACLYVGADTGKGGVLGSTINTGVANYVLNVDENAGTGFELDVNSNGTKGGVQDGGEVRAFFAAGGGVPGNAFGKTDGTGSVAFASIHSDYIGGFQPWGTAFEAKSCIMCFRAYVDAGGLGSTGTPYSLVSANGVVTWKVDVNGYETAAGLYSQTSLNTITTQLRGRTFSALPACSATYDGLQANVTDGPASPTWGQTVTAGGGTQHMLLYCDGTNWTVAAK